MNQKRLKGFEASTAPPCIAPRTFIEKMTKLKLSICHDPEFNGWIRHEENVVFNWFGGNQFTPSILGGVVNLSVINDDNVSGILFNVFTKYKKYCKFLVFNLTIFL